MEKLVRRQQSFEDLVATILARFASSVASDIDCHIQDSLREIGQFVGVDYAFCHPDRNGFRLLERHARMVRSGSPQPTGELPERSDGDV